MFLSYAKCSEFQLFIPIWDATNNLTIAPTSLVNAPNHDLVDFEITEDRIWGLWCNSEGDMHISAYRFDGMLMDFWVTAILEGISGKRRTIEAEMDAKHVYCSTIFRPGKFQASTISKALMVIKQHDFK